MDTLGSPETDTTESSADRGEQPNHLTSHKHRGLGQLSSTAICGNDITSSCLYVSALAIIYAGR